MTLPFVQRVWSIVCACLVSVLATPLYAGAPVASPKHAGNHAGTPAMNKKIDAPPPGYGVGVLNLRPPQLCFASGTPPEVIAAVDTMTATWGGRDAYQFADTARWKLTAHQKDVRLSQGDPTTLSWSIIPDGTSIAAFNPSVGESSDPSDLIAFLDGIYGGASESNLQLKPWFHFFQETFDRWGELTGTTYIYEENDDGRRLGVIAWPGAVGVRGDIRIGGHAIDGDSGVLAYNFFPDVGDMVIDTSDNFFENKDSDSHRLRNVILHEHGHGLGMSHVCPVNETKLMEPFYTDVFLGPQFDDILGAQRGYGDSDEPNDASDEATAMGTLDNGSYDVTGVSIDDENDSDWYRLDLAAGKRLSATVTPVGSTYLSGPQQLDGDCTAGDPFNALAQQDLGVEVIWTDGSTVLARADEQAAGMPETIANVNLGDAAGGYFIRVFGTTPNKAQMYALNFVVADALPSLPRFVAAASRKLHGDPNAGGVEYDLPLALGGKATVEPREGGVDRIILKFNEPVNLSCADVSLTSATCDTVTDLGDQMTWELDLNDVPENSCETLTLLASLGLGVTSPKSVRMLNILADVNQNGVVDFRDNARVKINIIGKPKGVVDETTFLSDIDLSNDINIMDLSKVKSNIRGSASCTP